SVGMRPLERSIEKLDDVRRKKLSEMISGSEHAVPVVLLQVCSFLLDRDSFLEKKRFERLRFPLQFAFFIYNLDGGKM
ncbi:Cytoskeleton-associated protein 5, partial [Sesbania bispinosa]